MYPLSKVLQAVSRYVTCSAISSVKADRKRCLSTKESWRKAPNALTPMLLGDVDVCLLDPFGCVSWMERHIFCIVGRCRHFLDIPGCVGYTRRYQGVYGHTCMTYPEMSRSPVRRCCRATKGSSSFLSSLRSEQTWNNKTPDIFTLCIDDTQRRCSWDCKYGI